jgi:hypothetical protein
MLWTSLEIPFYSLVPSANSPIASRSPLARSSPSTLSAADRPLLDRQISTGCVADPSRVVQERAVVVRHKSHLIASTDFQQEISVHRPSMAIIFTATHYKEKGCDLRTRLRPRAGGWRAIDVADSGKPVLRQCPALGPDLPREGPFGVTRMTTTAIDRRPPGPEIIPRASGRQFASLWRRIESDRRPYSNPFNPHRISLPEGSG